MGRRGGAARAFFPRSHNPRVRPELFERRIDRETGGEKHRVSSRRVDAGIRAVDARRRRERRVRGVRSHLLHLLLADGHGHHPGAHLHDGGDVTGEHTHVTGRRRHLHLLHLLPVELDLVRHEEVQGELRGRRRRDLAARLDEIRGRVRKVHRRGLDGLELAHERGDRLLLPFGGGSHRGRPERARGDGRRRRPEGGHAGRGLAKSHFDRAASDADLRAAGYALAAEANAARVTGC